MALRMDKAKARRQLVRALELARSEQPLPPEWTSRVEEVASFEDRTCLVVLGTALLATATDDTVDALTLKARAGNKAYSARGLAHDVLVPASVDEGFDLRTTGREPLNNQPYFHSDRVDDMPRVKHPEEVRYLVECLEAVDYLREDEAIDALAAYLRHRLAARQAVTLPDLGHTSADLARIRTACQSFLDRSAESGKRAQALVAAAFDLTFDDVRTARVFDPSRRLPGDVQTFHKLSPVMAAEVRAKAVSRSDATYFIQSAARAGFPHAMIVALSSIDVHVMAMSGCMSADTGVFVTVRTDFCQLLTDALAWSRRPLPELLQTFPKRVVGRLTQLEVKTSSLAEWGELVSKKQP